MNPIQTFTYQQSTVRTVERDGETFYILLEKYDGEWLIDSSIW